MFQRPIQPQGGRKGKKSFHTLCYMVCKGKFTFNTLVYLTVYHHFPFLPTCPSSSTALSSYFAFSRSHSFTFYPLSLPHFGTHQSSLGNALTHQHSNSHLLAWLDLSQLSEQIQWAGSHVNCGNMGYTGRSGLYRQKQDVSFQLHRASISVQTPYKISPWANTKQTTEYH